MENYKGSGLKKLRKAVSKLAATRKTPKGKGQGKPKGKPIEEMLGGEGETERNVESWFLGPKGENAALFQELITQALSDHIDWRNNFHPEDPSPIPEEVKADEGFQQAVTLLRTELNELLTELRNSGPFFSMRYQGHMLWDQTLAGMAGYFAGMLYNQNNTAIEAAPFTTVLEVEAAKDICEMVGYQYDTEGIPEPWGHLTCGGSTANIEALWAARNLKYYPLSLQKPLNDSNSPLYVANNMMVKLPSGDDAQLATLDPWSTLNLGIDEILGLSERLLKEYQIQPDTVTEATSPYTLQNLGFVDFTKIFLQDTDIQTPVIFVPGSKHYSLPKGAAILGVGANQMRSIPLDIHGRMNSTILEEQIDQCLSEKRPVITVVGVLGTTEEGNVDPLKTVLDLRDNKYRPQNIEFAVHADAAWGGYFAAMLETKAVPVSTEADEPVPVLPMSDYVYAQYDNLYRTDTVTVDPHKTGYMPYPAGALCYRNMLMRSLIAFEAPYTNTGEGSEGQDEYLLGTYGIEGSKPGAAAAGVYLSHKVIPPEPSGYGKILGRTLYNCKMFHWKLLELSESAQGYGVFPVPIEDPEGPISNYASKKEFRDKLRSLLAGKRPKEILNGEHTEALELLKETGADLNILTYAFNFKNSEGNWNQDLEAANEFNRKIYDRISLKLVLPEEEDENVNAQYNVLVSTTDFQKDYYGEEFFNNYKQRLLQLPAPVNSEQDKEITVMRSVVMDPWIAENLDGSWFLDTIIAELDKVVLQVLAEMNNSSS
ncbi:pyridoxal phosphate-dependent decarboxylase family protein [Moorena producens]|nr:pyridoxal-dependent decarboxylase [Moorena producens]